MSFAFPSVMSFLLPLLLLSSNANVEKPATQAEQPEGEPIEGEALAETQSGECADVGDDLASDGYESVDPADIDTQDYWPTDDDVATGLQRSGRMYGSSPMVSSVPTLTETALADAAEEFTGYDAPIEMPRVNNTPDNKFAHEISGYQNQLSRILQMAKQMPDHQQTLIAKLGADFDPTTLVDGRVDANDLMALNAFVEIFAPDTSLQTSWGSDGYSKEVIAQLDVVSAQVDEALAFDFTELNAAPDDTASLVAMGFEADTDYALYDADSANSDQPVDDACEDACELDPAAMPISVQLPETVSGQGLDMAAIQAKYEGTPYGTYDCVTFVEQVLKDAGYELDHAQMMCIPGKGGLEASFARGDASLEGAPRALIDARAGVAVNPKKAMPEGTVVQYWYYDRDGQLRGHAGIVSKVYEDGTVDLYGAHQSSGRVTTKHVNLNAGSVAKVFAAYPLPSQPALA